ncbi:type II secretion system F family protein [Buchananella felis]|uniref:type II secretion system F family protein n=1 Tax=Buchananella felis TaxID=3231492 RepID=UPI0035275163
MSESASLILVMALLVAAVAGLVPALPAHWRHLDRAGKELERARRERRKSRRAGEGGVGGSGDEDASGAGGTGDTRGGASPTPARWWRSRQARRPALAEQSGARDVGMLALEVAALVRSGLELEAAWTAGLERNWDKLPAEPSQDGRLPAALATAIRRARLPPPWWEAWAGRRRAEQACGATALSSMGVACGASAELGAPLAPVLEAVAQGVARAGEVAQERRVQLAAPLATARVLRVLPLGGLLLGGLLGVDPLGVLLDSPLGVACLAVGLAAMLVGNVWLSRLVRAAEEQGARVDPAVLVDVCGACMRAGSAVPTVLQAIGAALTEVVGEASEGQDATMARELQQCGRMLLLGASWELAWERVEPQLLPLNRALRAAWEDGAAPEGMLAHAAALLRARQVRRARVAAAELGTKLIAPVSVCMLPAFISLGIVPVVLGGALGLLAS